MFLDEPTTGLDPRSRNQVWDIVRALAAGGTTILLCTQYLDEADRLADGIAVIDHGRVIAEGRPRSAGGIGRIGRAPSPPARCRPASRRRGHPLPDACGRLRLEPDTAALSAPSAEADKAALAVGELSPSGIAVATFSLGEPTLDEVFLALTGQPVEHDEATDIATAIERRAA